MRRSTFAQAAIGEGAAALNRVFSEYAIPITFSSEHLHLHMSYNDVVASASPLWYDDDGTFLAAALLAVRGKRAWIGGFGVSPEHRSRGYAKALLAATIESAKHLGAQSISLEVLAGNMPAIGLYERGGFHIERRFTSLELLTGEAPNVDGFLAASVEELIDEPESVRPCWQRERGTLRNGAVSSGIADEHGNYALFRFNANLAQVLKIRAHAPEDLTRIGNAIGAERELSSVIILNEPDESPILRFARSAQWEEMFVQYEMLQAI